MAIGAVTVAPVFMQAQIERRAMLNHSLVQGRQHHMVVLVQLGNGDNQQSMLLTSVAINNRRVLQSTIVVQ